jgi:hypothetical protein
MKFAAIYKDKKGYIFTPMSKTVSGLLVSSEPEIRVFKQASTSKKIEAFLQVINASMQNIEDYRFQDSSIEKQKVKQKLQSLAIRSFNELNKKPTLYCSVKVENEVIALIPSKTDVSLGKGYISKPDEKVFVSLKADIDEMLHAIEETFNRCE